MKIHHNPDGVKPLSGTATNLSLSDEDMEPPFRVSSNDSLPVWLDSGPVFPTNTFFYFFFTRRMCQEEKGFQQLGQVNDPLQLDADGFKEPEDDSRFH